MGRLGNIFAFILFSCSWQLGSGECLTKQEILDGAKVVGLDLNDDGANLQLEYHTFGVDSNSEGVTRMILQHGTGREGGVFGYFETFFRAHNIAVIAPTMPGHGCSSRLPNRTIGDYGLLVSKALEKEGWLEVNADKSIGFMVAGYSFGSSHALAILACPKLERFVNGVFMVSSTLPPELRKSLDSDVNLPEEIIPFKSIFLHQQIGPNLFSFLRTVAKRKLLGKLYKAMDAMRADGFSALAEWLEASSDRSFQRGGTAGIVDNLRLRESEWGKVLTESRNAFLRKPSDFPFLILAEQNDTIDPSSVSSAIAKYMNNQSFTNAAKFEEWVIPSKHGHWHYWPRFEEQLRRFLTFAGVNGLPHFEESQNKVCQPSPSREYGPFYKLGQPFKTSICEKDSLIEDLGWAVADSTFKRSYRRGAQPLYVSGTVTEWDGTSCIPVAGAEIDIWQSHQFGPYGSLDVGVQDGFCRGVVLSDENGKFSFSTYMPSSYGALAGSGPYGPGFDVPPFVDRHIHLAIWAPGRELLVTQILHLDDPLLQSGIRSAPHGYEGSGILVQPQKDGESWQFQDVLLTMPRTLRPSRIHHDREEAARDFCSYSTGDFLVPAVCMPRVTNFLSPMKIYFLLMPCTIYLWAPLFILITAALFIRQCFCTKSNVKNIKFKVA